mmetsp:Transcript_13731/g.22030  ORF Transcript_13731/g.22030 Transcript_13731/m.22030 type:complete len:250 (+) Transcript_13731:2666-3415(+)
MKGRKRVSRTQRKPRFTTREGTSYQCSLAEFLMAWAMWCGKMRKHSTSEARRTTITVKGMSAIKSPKRPPMAVRPKKAITVVMVEENTGNDMRFAAFSAATKGGSLRRRARASACSPTTIASSTTMPSVMMRPKREIILIVNPAAYISATAANIAVGIPAATQKAVRALRNRNNSTTTNASPMSPLSISKLRRPVIASARVRISSSFTPWGKVACISAATSSTARCMAMASPASVRSTRIDMAGSSPTK